MSPRCPASTNRPYPRGEEEVQRRCRTDREPEEIAALAADGPVPELGDSRQIAGVDTGPAHRLDAAHSNSRMPSPSIGARWT
jgi:hypothetical protein